MSKLPFITSRIPSISHAVKAKRNEFGFGQGGFVHFTIHEHRADIYFYARDLQLEYQANIPPRNLKDLPGTSPYPENDKKNTKLKGPSKKVKRLLRGNRK
jgi:hypothetical protein